MVSWFFTFTSLLFPFCRIRIAVGVIRELMAPAPASPFPFSFF